MPKRGERFGLLLLVAGCGGELSPTVAEPDRPSTRVTSALDDRPREASDHKVAVGERSGKAATDHKVAVGDSSGKAATDHDVAAGDRSADPTHTSALPCAAPPADMACIPGGPFIRGSDDGPEDARPAATLWLQTFYMDRFEVTYAQYKACETAKRCPPAKPRYTDYDHPDMPMTGVSWFDAQAYCAAQGKGLPTEAQWEKAARGPDGALFPWGDEPVTCARAIYRDASGRSCGLKKAISKPDTGRPWDVGSRPAGVYGLFDMVGNSWEWVADWYSNSYAECGDDCIGADPKGPCAGAARCPGHRRKVLRGGSWYWDETYATPVVRRAHVPHNQPFHHFGFRCAATVEQAAGLVAGQSPATH